MRGVLASLEEHVSPRLYWIMRDLRSTIYELVKGHWASPRECVNPRLHWKMWDLRSTSDKLVRRPLASLGKICQSMTALENGESKINP